MNKQDAERQITAMIGFIRQEAKEKAEDIMRDIEREATADKLNKERTLTSSIKDEYAKKKKDKIVNKRIERSRKENEARITRMRERDNIIKQLKEEVLEKLADVAKDKKYPDLVKYLIVQGLMTITENKIILQCRKEDVAIVKAQIDGAVKLYQEFIKTNTGIVPKCQVDLSNEFLAPAPVKGRKQVSCSGGVVLSSRNGTIVCRNTLDSRLELCFDNLIPQVRALLFGVRDAPNVKAAKEPSHH